MTPTMLKHYVVSPFLVSCIPADDLAAHVSADKLFGAVAQLIARLPRDQHAGELGRLVAAFERYGVAVPEQWRCDLEEMV